ncbi:hypothetical protein WICPIJ_002303 [Wickerhamomyces pijperi]|uniref:Protein MUM2 n=1 Tax=Wickerhamomyces pijperi TaxID=599730 RepID=A0A9P8Q9E2_WICPI|nr:hypothetical protein WICPIJ_002303 [Wickerhamomyces pijperi]
MNSPFNSYFKTDQGAPQHPAATSQGPIALSTAPSSSNLNHHLGSSQSMDQSNLSNITNTSNSQFSSSAASSNFFNSNSQPLTNTASTYWNQQQLPQQQLSSHHGSIQGITMGMNMSNISNMNNINQLSNAMQNTELEYYKSTLRIKENIISQLESELSRIRQLQSSTTNTATEPLIPSTHVQIFESLATKLAESQKELKETKTKLDALTASIIATSPHNVTPYGQSDSIETYHKILIKLQNLETENKELLKVLSFGKLKSVELSLRMKEVEIEELKEQNEQLKRQLKN